jgi:Na+/melibiose symporter-like transporter
VAYGLIPIYYPDRVGECVAYFELAIGFGQGIGANIGILLKNLFNSNFLAFLAIAIFYLYFTHPLLKPVPEDNHDQIEEDKENLSYMEFLRNPKFLCVNLSQVITITGNVFLLTGIVFGIDYFPGHEGSLSYLMGLYSIVYGIAMYFLSQMDGKIQYEKLMLAGFLV